jgi:hypothetical protein
LDQWKALRPDLFHKHEDGKIGPNSSHHDQRGKIGNPACVECGSTTTPLHTDGVWQLLCRREGQRCRIVPRRSIWSTCDQ